MANATFDEKVDDLISKHVGGPKPRLGFQGSPYALIPQRDPNDPLDRFVFGNLQKVGFGPMLPEGYQGKPPAASPRPQAAIPGRGGAIPVSASQYYEGPGDMDFNEGAISSGQAMNQAARSGWTGYRDWRAKYEPDWRTTPGGSGQPAIDTSRFPSAPGSPTLQDVSRQALGFPRFGSTEEGINRIGALPDRTPMGAINPNAQAAMPAASESPRGAIPERNMGDMVLAANRGPASGYSYNPRGEDMGNYEYGGKFNGKDVYFWKPQNDMQSIFNNAKSAIMEYQRRNPNDPMIGAVENLLNAMNINPNAESARNLQGAHAELYRGQAGAIPSEIEERGARAKHYGRENPFVLGPGQRAFVPGREPGAAATRIAEGAEERPGTTGMEKMNEFDKVQYQAAAHIAQNSIDPEQQKLAFEKMDEIGRKYSGPKMDRNTAYEKLKATGKYSDDQINAKLQSLGLR